MFAHGESRANSRGEPGSSRSRSTNPGIEHLRLQLLDRLPEQVEDAPGSPVMPVSLCTEKLSSLFRVKIPNDGSCAR